jgi:hypothetical protein
MNEFVEVLLGGSIVIPIAVAYLGLDWVQANVGLQMGFRTMPTLFQNWGPIFAAISGVAWFGLLFFAGITSSLAMGQPVMAFLQDEYKMDRVKSARTFGIICLLLALPCIFFFGYGAFTEYDDWVGTYSLVVFALLESIAFAYVFGIDKGWEEINRGADIKIPHFFRFVIKYVTPVFLLAVFIGSLFAPQGGEWAGAFDSLFSGNGWPLDPGSIVGKILHLGIDDTRWFVDGSPTRTFIIDATRILLTLTFIAIALAVRAAWQRKAKQAG